MVEAVLDEPTARVRIPPRRARETLEHDCSTTAARSGCRRSDHGGDERLEEGAAQAPPRAGDGMAERSEAVLF